MGKNFEKGAAQMAANVIIRELWTVAPADLKTSGAKKFASKSKLMSICYTPCKLSRNIFLGQYFVFFHFANNLSLQFWHSKTKNR